MTSLKSEEKAGAKTGAPKTRIYSISDNAGARDVELIEARSAQEIYSFICQRDYKVKPAPASELVRLLNSGASISSAVIEK